MNQLHQVGPALGGPRLLDLCVHALLEGGEPFPAAQDAHGHRPRWALIAAAAALAAGLVKLIGARKVARAVSDGAGVAARATASAASGAAKTVGRAVSSPLRGLLMIAGLGMVALFGVGLYDVEWLGGLIVGALMAGAGALGLRKAARILRPVKAKGN